MSNPAILIDCEESHTQLDVNLIKICRKQYCVHVFGPAKKTNQLKQYLHDEHIMYHEKAERSQAIFVERSDFPTTIYRLFKRKLHSYRSIKRNANTFRDIMKRYRINSVIFSTASSIYYLMELYRMKGCSVIIFLHNLNRWISTKKYKVSVITLLINRRFLKKVSCIYVLQDYLRDFVKNNSKIPCNVFPFKLSDKETIEKRKKILSGDTRPKFVIPGTVEIKRKQYKWVFEEMAKIEEDFQIVLLGRVVDKETIEFAKGKLGNKVKYFDGYIPEEVFLEEMINSHAIIANCNMNLPYGIYKASGVEFDGPVFGVPIIIENGLLSQNKNAMFLRFSDLFQFRTRVEKIIRSVNSGSYLEEFFEPAAKIALSYDKKIWEKKFLFEISEFIHK